MKSVHKIYISIAIGLILSFTIASCTTPAATVKPAQTPPIPAATETPTPAPRPTLPGDKFDVGGYNLYIDCKGTGSPTVILESGLEGDVVTWKSVHPEVAKFTRVCRYDRAGLAHSDYGPTPRNAELASQDLHALLTKAGITPPYILVGHSFGGLLIRRYTFDFPDDVTGMIFVDSLQEDWWEEALALLPPDPANDTPRLASFRLYLTEGWRDPSSNFEAMDIPAVVEQVRGTDGFVDIPITVLTAGNFTVLSPGLPSDLETRLAALFHDEQSRLAALSTIGTQVVIPDTGHNMPLQNPQAVVDAINQMVSTVQ